MLKQLPARGPEIRQPVLSLIREALLSHAAMSLGRVVLSLGVRLVECRDIQVAARCTFVMGSTFVIADSHAIVGTLGMTLL